MRRLLTALGIALGLVGAIPVTAQLVGNNYCSWANPNVCSGTSYVTFLASSYAGGSSTSGGIIEAINAIQSGPYSGGTVVISGTIVISAVETITTTKPIVVSGSSWNDTIDCGTNHLGSACIQTTSSCANPLTFQNMTLLSLTASSTDIFQPGGSCFSVINTHVMLDPTTPYTYTGTANSTSITGVANVQGIAVNSFISGTNLQDQARIISIADATHFTVSAGGCVSTTAGTIVVGQLLPSVTGSCVVATGVTTLTAGTTAGMLVGMKVVLAGSFIAGTRVTAISAQPCPCTLTITPAALANAATTFVVSHTAGLSSLIAGAVTTDLLVKDNLIECAHNFAVDVNGGDRAHFIHNIWKQCDKTAIAFEGASDSAAIYGSDNTFDGSNSIGVYMTGGHYFGTRESFDVGLRNGSGLASGQQTGIDGVGIYKTGGFAQCDQCTLTLETNNAAGVPTSGLGYYSTTTTRDAIRFSYITGELLNAGTGPLDVSGQINTSNPPYLVGPWISPGGGFWSSVTFACATPPAIDTCLPTSPTAGQMLYCSDCTSTCAAGSSTGAICARVNGAWLGL